MLQDYSVNTHSKISKNQHLLLSVGFAVCGYIEILVLMTVVSNSFA